jgi:hypothetical protein
MKNKLKYESYQVAMRLLENAKRHKDMPMCIAAVAVAESIIADRCQSYLYFKEKGFMETREKEKRYVTTKELIDKCGKHFKTLQLTIKPKTGKEIGCKDLFGECQLWLKERNNILHGFAKSKPREGTKNIVEFHHNAIDAAENGLRLTKLVSKWHKQQLQITNKKK